jgi:hypothetical protein
MNEPNIQPNKSVSDDIPESHRTVTPANLPAGVREALNEITKLRKEAYEAGQRVGFQRGFEAGVAAGLGQAPKYPNGPAIQ